MSIYEGSIEELSMIESLWSEFLVANLSTDELFNEELSRVKSLWELFLLSNLSQDKLSRSSPFGKVFPWVVTIAVEDFAAEFGDCSTLLAVVVV